MTTEASTPSLSPEDRAYLRSLAPATPSPYHRLNPLTKAIVATVSTLAAFVLGGYVAPAAILVLLVLPGAIAARVTARLVRVALLISLPISISVALVSVFTRAGTTVLFTIGPFDATLEGVDFAAQVIVRLFVLAMALGLFGLTTEPRAFVVDLERRGLSPKIAFAAAATLETIPLMIERALAIQAAQRARGLDTEGSLATRIRGVMPLVGPVILSSLTEVEERSLALEVRAFGKPGRRDLLWTLPDDARQRILRWALVAAFVALTIGRVAGLVPALP
ncbi:MAG TPA: energy-coupling factor transporter transmembrane component T [Candidatus Limnocylindrales bacterium]|nr:energy-coupling factor transporter transmembrane component T [Candidatus Limnocylindrales bacterium]